MIDNLHRLQRNGTSRLKYLVFFVCCSLSIASFAQATKKPNIVIILADDLGWGDLGFHGSEIMTPNIDKLAQQGVILSRFYTAPICSPTRAGIMTGKYPNRFGLRETVIPPWSKFGVDLDEKFLPEYLKEAGYKNRIALGKWHLGHAKKEFLPLSRGFTHFYGHYNGAIDYFTHNREAELDWHNDWETSFDKGYSTDLISIEAVKNIRQYAGEKDPFFMYVAFNSPHTPLQAKREDLLKYGFDPDKPTFSEEKNGYGGEGKGNTERQTYAAMVTCMDRGIGRILETLKEKGIDKNTLVLFFSDNGANVHGGGSSGSLRGHKFMEWDGGVRSPAIIKWPSRFKGGRTVDQLAGYIDLIPTLLDAANAEPVAENLDGKDILPVIEGKQQSFDRELYLGYGSMIQNKWKLVSSHGGNSAMKNEEDEVFQIVEDPNEKKNIKDKNGSVYKTLKEKVTTYDSIKPKKSVPPYGYGRKGFKAPKNWEIKND